MNILTEELLSEKETEWLNSYHKEVYSILSPYLNKEHQVWLEKMCKAI